LGTEIFAFVKEHFLVIADDDLADVHPSGDPLVPIAHRVNVVLEFIDITIPTTRIDVIGDVSHRRNDAVDAKPRDGTSMAICTLTDD
jgi:hypothetical protein